MTNQCWINILIFDKAKRENGKRSESFKWATFPLRERNVLFSSLHHVPCTMTSQESAVGCSSDHHSSVFNHPLLLFNELYFSIQFPLENFTAVKHVLRVTVLCVCICACKRGFTESFGWLLGIKGLL